MNCERF